MYLIHKQKGDSSKGEAPPPSVSANLLSRGWYLWLLCCHSSSSLHHFLIRIIFSDTETQELIRGPATAGAGALLDLLGLCLFFFCPKLFWSQSLQNLESRGQIATKNYIQ